MRKSISTRFFYSSSILLIAGITVMGFMHMYLSIGYFGTERRRALENTLDITVNIFEEYETTTGDMGFAARTLGVAREMLITSKATDNFVMLTNENGKILFSNSTQLNIDYMGVNIPDEMISEIKHSGKTSGMGTFKNMLDEPFYYVGQAITLSSGEIIGYAFALSDTGALLAYLSSILSIFIISAGLMLVISSILSIWLTARMTTPLKSMADAAKKFGKGDFSVRVSENGDDEIVQLSKSFNAMADSLQKIDSSRASFMGNIAHELRTPMTTIKGFVDGMLDGTIPAENNEHYLEIVSQEAGRLTRLIKNMLDITRLESGDFTVNAQYYDIWESITGVVFASEQRIAQQKIKLVGFTPVCTLVYADWDLVYQVIYNIFDNALKFTNEGGTIEFSVISSKDEVTINIRNTGEGISEDGLKYVFERFYKEDESRGLNTTGSGLGLHICKVLVKMNGGHIWASSNYGKDCTFSFTLPKVSKDKSAKNGDKNQKTSSSKHLPANSNTAKEICIDSSEGEMNPDSESDIN